jgi:teichuronic acid biosynthesis glycosyltransferase TuaC
VLKVLTFSTLYPTAARPGFGGFVARQTERLAALPDVEVKVVAPMPGIGPARREVFGGLDVWRPRFPAVPKVGWSWNPAMVAHAAEPVLRRIRAEGFAFDVIDAEFFYPCGVAAAALGQVLGVPVSIKSRGSDIAFWGGRRRARAAILIAASRASGLLAVSDSQKAAMVALGIPADRIAVHYTGLDLEHFALTARPAGREVLSVGNLIALKGHDIVVRAVASLPGVTLRIAGEGPERGALNRLIARLGVGDRVRLLGAVPHARMPDLLGSADVLALASEREGLANVWVEALACGTPVVAPPVGSIGEVLDRPEAGRVAEARTPEAFAAAIAAVLGAPSSRAAVRAAALRFDWARNTAELHAHLARCAGSRL